MKFKNGMLLILCVSLNYSVGYASITPDQAKELDAVISTMVEQEVQPEEIAQAKKYVISEERIAQYKKEYQTSINRMSKLQKVAKGAFAIGALYATYYVGSGLYHWLRGTEVVAPVIAPENLAREIAILKQYLPTHGFFMSQLKNIGSLLVSSYVAGVFAQIYLFTSQSIHERQLKTLEVELQRNIFLFSYALDQLILYQINSPVSDLVYDQNYKAVGPLSDKMITTCERYIALFDIFNEHFPASLLQEQKLQETPTYLASLTNKIFSDIQDAMHLLAITPHDSQCINTMKARLDLLRTEIIAVTGRMVLILSNE